MENSVAGTVGQTLDLLLKSRLRISGEIAIPIRHNLAGFGSIKDIKEIYMHPQTLEQCSEFISRKLNEPSAPSSISTVPMLS